MADLSPNISMHVSCICSKSCPTLLQPHELQLAGLLCLWDFPGKNTGTDFHFLLQVIFPTQGSNPCLLCLLYWQVDSLPLSHLENNISMYAESLQLCLTLYDPMDSSLSGSSVKEILQARIQEWVAFSSPVDFPDPESQLMSVASAALAGGFFTTRAIEFKWSKYIS